MRPPTTNNSTHYACRSSGPCASSAATSPGRRVFPLTDWPPASATPSQKSSNAPIRPDDTEPTTRDQTSRAHQIPTKNAQPQKHQTQRATRNPAHTPTKLTALGWNEG